MKDIILLLIILGLFGCKKEIKEMGPLRLVWETTINPKELCTTFNPVIDDKYLFCANSTLSGDGNGLFKIDKTTGTILARYNEVTKESYTYSSDEMCVDDRNFYFTSREMRLCLDKSTFLPVYKIPNESKGATRRLLNHNNFIIDTDYQYDSVRYVAVDKTQGGLTSLANIQKTRDDSYTMFAPSVGQLEGRSYLIGAREYGIYTSQKFYQRAFLTIIDLASKEVVLDTMICPDEVVVERYLKQPILYDNTILYAVKDRVIGQDFKTGQIRWTVPFTRSSIMSSHFHEGVFYMITNDGEMVAIDVSAGKLRWRNFGQNTNPGPIRAYRGKVFYCGNGDGLLHVIDNTTGGTIEKKAAPYSKDNSNLFFDSYLSIDQSTGRLYVGDYRHLFCYQIEE